MENLDLVSNIRVALREATDPLIAPGQQAYMKSELPFLGVRVPAVRALTQRLARREGDAPMLRITAVTLWREATHREERYAASALMALPLLRGRLDMLDVHEEMIRSGAWWDHVDEVAHRLTDLLSEHPAEMTVILYAWAHDEDMWIRRASIISQLGRKADVDHALLTHAIEENTRDDEFFIRKAIGWALRDLAWFDPDWVLDFVAQHPELSPLSRREALKNIT